MLSFKDEFSEGLSMLSSLAQSLGVDWMVIGGVAVASWGEPRNTKDLDFGIATSIDRAPEVHKILESFGWHLIEGPGQIKDTNIWLSLFEKEGRKLTIDVFYSMMSEWQRHAIGRRRYIKFMDRDYWTASPEDLIIFKLIADRGKDKDDIDSVLDRLGSNLDRPYIDKWSTELGIRPRWIEAMTRHQDRRDAGI